jgi:glutathionyl-hydroquinone reductase
VSGKAALSIRTISADSFDTIVPRTLSHRVDPHMGEEGWVFGDSPGATPDPIHGARRLYEVYLP